jgi:predicted nucleotidyltransferase component of viral defense system
MEKIPLILRLKKESHRRIARAQDLIVETLYDVFNDAVLHGGTGIWRCYSGNRFSEDIDVYIHRNLEKLSEFFLRLEKKGFEIKKKKIGENSLFSNLLFEGIEVRFEALFKKTRGWLKDYEKAEGNLITVYSLTPEEFILEKIDTYIKRRKIRDLYDIYFLLKYADRKKLKDKLNKFVHSFQMPVDEEDLKILILEGVVPSSEKMLEYMRS